MSVFASRGEGARWKGENASVLIHDHEHNIFNIRPVSRRTREKSETVRHENKPRHLV